MTLETVSQARAFGGVQGVYRHDSEATGTPMTFAVYVPEHEAGARLPVSGLVEPPGVLLRPLRRASALGTPRGSLTLMPGGSTARGSRAARRRPGGKKTKREPAASSATTKGPRKQKTNKAKHKDKTKDTQNTLSKVVGCAGCVFGRVPARSHGIA